MESACDFYMKYARMPKTSVERIKSLAKAENKAVGDYLQDALKLR